MLLRRWLVSDAEALARAVTESEGHLRPWMAFMAHEPQTLEQRRVMLRERERKWLQGGDVMLGVFVDGEVAGVAGFTAGEARLRLRSAIGCIPTTRAEAWPVPSCGC